MFRQFVQLDYQAFHVVNFMISTKFQRRLKTKKLADTFHSSSIEFAYNEQRDVIECYYNQRLIKIWKGGEELTTMITQLRTELTKIHNLL